jgi:hypothetical protein
LTISVRQESTGQHIVADIEQLLRLTCATSGVIPRYVRNAALLMRLITSGKRA